MSKNQKFCVSCKVPRSGNFCEECGKRLTEQPRSSPCTAELENNDHIDNAQLTEQQKSEQPSSAKLEINADKSNIQQMEQRKSEHQYAAELKSNEVVRNNSKAEQKKTVQPCAAKLKSNEGVISTRQAEEQTSEHLCTAKRSGQLGITPDENHSQCTLLIKQGNQESKISSDKKDCDDERQPWQFDLSNVNQEKFKDEIQKDATLDESNFTCVEEEGKIKYTAVLVDNAIKDNESQDGIEDSYSSDTDNSDDDNDGDNDGSGSDESEDYSSDENSEEEKDEIDGNKVNNIVKVVESSDSINEKIVQTIHNFSPSSEEGKGKITLNMNNKNTDMIPNVQNNGYVNMDVKEDSKAADVQDKSNNNKNHNKKSKKKERKRRRKEQKMKGKKEKHKTNQENKEHKENEKTISKSSVNTVQHNDSSYLKTNKPKEGSWKGVEQHGFDVMVHFYVTLLPEFATILKNRYIVISMEPNWSNRLTMEVVRYFDNGKILLHGSSIVNRECVGRKISYKYVFIKQSNPKDYVWEVLYTGKILHGFANRVLEIPESYPDNEIFYQIDDIVIPQQQNSLSKTVLNALADFFIPLADGEKRRHYLIQCESIFLEIMNLCYNGILPCEDASQLKKMLFLKRLYKGFFDSSIKEHFSSINYKDHLWEKINTSSRNYQLFVKSIYEQLKGILKAIRYEKDNLRKINHIVTTLSIGILLDTNKLLHNVDMQLIKCFFEVFALENIESCLPELMPAIKETFKENASTVEDSLRVIWRINLNKQNETLSTSWCHPLNFLHLLNGFFEPDPCMLDINKLHGTVETALYGVFRMIFKAEFLYKTFDDIYLLKDTLRMNKTLQLCLGHIMNVQCFQMAISSDCFDDSILIKMMSTLLQKEYNLVEEKCDVLTVTFTQIKTKEITVDKERLEILSSLIELASGLLKISGVTVELYTVVFSSLFTYDHKITSSKVDENFKSVANKWTEKKRDIMQGIEKLLYSQHWNSINEEGIRKKLKFLDVLLSFQDLNIGKCIGIKKLVIENLSKCTKELVNKNTEIFLNIYGTLDKSYNTDMHAVFQKDCEALLKKLFAESCDSGLFNKILQYFEKEDNCFIKTFSNEWGKHITFEEKIQYMINWPPMESLLDFFYKKEKPETLKEVFESFKQVVGYYFEKICSSSIIVKELGFLWANEKNFKKMIRDFSTDTDDNQNIVLHFDENVKKIKEFNSVKNAIRYFLDFCKKHLPEGIVDLNEIHRKIQEEHEAMELKKIYPGQIRLYYMVDNSFIRTLVRMHDHQLFESKIFMKFWKNFIKKIDSENDPLDQSNIIEELVIPVQKELLLFLQSILKGEVSAKKVKEYFKNKGNQGIIEKELGRLIAHFEESMQRRESIQKLASKIHCVLAINEIKDIAEKILIVAKNLNLKGDFDTTEDMLLKANKRQGMVLRDFKENLVRDTSRLLTNVVEIETVVNAVTDNLSLIQWLRETLKGSHEVKTSIAMLKSAAGDKPMDVYLVRCFEESCSGFSAIFFDLNENSGFNEFHDACIKTSRHLVKNRNLATMLASSNNRLEWIKESYKSQKSFSSGAFMEAQLANQNGCYKIGLKNNSSGERNDLLGEKAELDSVVLLEITSDKQKRKDSEDAHPEIKFKSLNDIHDLQSRLMLLGGDNREGMQTDISFFLEHAEIATRLGNAFVSLHDAGDGQNLGWRKQFRINIDEAKLLGSVYFDNVKSEIKNLESRLDDWQDEFMEFRKNYPLANYFNNKQCLFLRKHLYRLTESIKNIHQVPPQVFTLLKSIHADITTKDIEHAFQFSYLGEYSEATKGRDDWKKADVENDNNFNLFSLKEIQKFLKLLNKHDDIEENVAKASIMRICPFDEKKAIIWCKKQDPDDEAIDDDAEIVEEELEKLGDSQDESDQEDKETTSNDQVPFLPLQQFGSFLSALGRLKQSTDRNPKNDNPISLIVPPEDEVLKAIIQIYLENDGELPKAEEVLLCDENVSTEQVKLFLLRCALTKGGLYCLAFADHLDFEIMAFVSEELQNYQGGNHLLVVCTSENKNQSMLAAQLHRYRTHQFVLADNSTLTGRLKKKLSQEQQIKKSDKFVYASSINNGYSSRVVASKRGGMGKTMYVKEQAKTLKRKLKTSTLYTVKRKNCKNKDVKITVPVHGIAADVDRIVNCLSEYELSLDHFFPRIYHFDIAPSVYKGLENLFFKIAVLGFLQASTGKIWKRNEVDLCLFEVTNTDDETHKELSSRKLYKGFVEKLLPRISCLTPFETFDALQRNGGKVKLSQRISTEQLQTEPYKRVSNYLSMFDEHQDLPQIPDYYILYDLVRHCGIKEPSWLELQNFVYFLNNQLKGSEKSCFTSELKGFRKFVVMFMLEMAKDFATRSLKNGEETEQLVELKRRWEHSHHPYLFFNDDGETFTFFGFRIRDGHLIAQDSDVVIQPNIMTEELYELLSKSIQNDVVNFETNFEKIDREIKLTLLCRVMGLEFVIEPDETYELTTDNMKKILAVYTRLRCDIPVVLMGETGCGKTRLIRFMCALRAGLQKNVQNMILVKVHGGVTVNDIVRHVEQTKKIAKDNYKKHGINTILFFDEVNTSDAIGLIKEIMIDRSVCGKPLSKEKCGLEIIAACNPYRRHSDLMVEKLKASGLGYHVSDVQTYEKIGNIPLRQLVYRVHPLPESLKPLVWDFGQLSDDTELAYSKLIIAKYMDDKRLPLSEKFADVLTQILARSQVLMRKQDNECSFVSLRDVERAVQVTAWFFNKMNFLMSLIKDFEDEKGIRKTGSNTRIEECNEKLRRSLVLAIGVCYIARLEERDQYMEDIVQYFTGEFKLENGVEQLQNEIKRFQQMFVDELELEDNIAKNQALCENIFMMVVCIELRIPLFIVGKPGSSKSLAKTIVEDHMQGNASKSRLFKHFKRIDMTSYQCSPLSTADGIISVFRQSAKYQKEKKLDEFSAVVVLDEVGLAEDSPRMPLKALHPLLEDGTDGSEDLSIENLESKEGSDNNVNKRVAFIGISNWSLDPAKMNRGLLLCRSPPGLEELELTARDICASDSVIRTNLLGLFKPLANAYEDLYTKQKESSVLTELKKEEFFGLRDFYCLIKMVFCYAKAHQSIPPLRDIELAVRRNFSGLEELDPWDIFKQHLLFLESTNLNLNQGTPDQVSTIEMIKSSILPYCPCSTITRDESVMEGPKRCTSSRYLLIMTEKYSALSILEGMFLDTELLKPRVIFGSSFPKDQEFTQVCRDINEIKMCMETGQTVVLLNMEKLYESLYDALNQYYVYLGGERFVDLGLGTHRVKCNVHKDFKLIVIADKKIVYQTFPIPLINRLEKHIVMASSSLNTVQTHLANNLFEWANEFAYIKGRKKEFGPPDAFIGFNSDTCPSIVIQLFHEGIPHDQIFEAGKRRLLKIATPDAVLRVRKTKLSAEKEDINTIYFGEQQHICLYDFLEMQFHQNKPVKFSQVTTFSRLLTDNDLACWNLHIDIKVIPLVKFQTEYSFRQALKEKLKECNNNRSLLIIQYSINEESSDVVACAQHICKELVQSSVSGNTFILFLLQLSSAQVIHKSLSGFQSFWECTHIDDVRRPDRDNPSFLMYCDQPVSCLFKEENLNDVVYILKSSLQPAMKEINSMKPMNPEMISTKIKILQAIIDADNDLSLKFIHIIMEQIHIFRKKKEELMCKPSYWIPEEQDNLPYYVTFRAALVSCLEDLIIPIWKNLLFLMDLDNNLLLLNEKENYRELWIEILQLCFQSGNLLLDEEPLHVDVVGSTMEKSQLFPFSQLIRNNIEKFLETKKDILKLEEDKNEVFVGMKQILENSPFSRILKMLSQNQMEDYLTDFFFFQFPGLSSESYKLLKNGLLIGMKSLKESLDPDDFNENTDQIALSYMAIAYFDEELSNSASIFRCKPSIVNKVQRRVAKDEFMVLDLKALIVLLKSFQPSNDNAKKREVGLSQNKELKEISRLIQQMLSRTIQRNDEEGKDVQVEKSKLLKEAKVIWMQLRLVQLYEYNILHVKNGSDDRFEKETVFELWKMLRTMQTEMSDIRSWNQLEIFLKRVLDKGTEQFKKQCTLFFIDVVSEFCFTKELLQKDNREVIERVMSYTFSTKGSQTKQFSPIQDNIDQSPVIRSFVLQQLLKHNINVEDYLQDYIDQNRRLLASNDNDMWNLCKLFIYCFEDTLAAEIASLCSNTKFEPNYLEQLTCWVNGVCSYFLLHQQIPRITVDLLKNIARARVAISAICKLLCERFLTIDFFDAADKDQLKKFFPTLINVINLGKNSEIHMFVLRQILHNYGYRELQKVIARSEYNWLNLEDDQANQQNVDSDKFLVYGEEYQNLRNTLTNIYMEQNPQDLKDLNERITDHEKWLLQLAILRETVLSEGYDINTEIFAKIMADFELQHVRRYVDTISQYTGDDVITEMLYHFFAMINISNTHLMQLYYLLFSQPNNCQQLFFPTMPRDNFEAIANIRRDNDASVPHACPNGHVYVIGNCGRAYTTARCPVQGCGLTIGGANHQLRSDNRRVNERDETKPGHSLGPQRTRTTFPSPEGNLGVLSTTLQRLLVHLAMLAGAVNGHAQQILRLITPQITPGDLTCFLTRHIQHDLELLKDVLGKNNDDTRFTVHLFIKHLKNTNNPRGQAANIDSLRTKQGRDEFEMAFHREYIENFKTTIENELQIVKRLSADDMRVGGNPVVRRLYELDPPDHENLTNIPPINSQQLWRYRQPFGISHLRLKVQERQTQSNGQANLQLHTFLQAEWLYQLLSELPKVLQFQRILYQQLNFRMEKETAGTKTLKHALDEIKNEEAKKKLKRMKKSICKLWNRLSSYLKKNGPFIPDQDFHPATMSDNTTLDYFLASDEGAGRCIKSVIAFLIALQNDFLCIYERMPNSFIKDKRKLAFIQESDIMMYTQQDDLLPIIHLNCDYSLEIGKGTRVEYNLGQIEQKLMERICYGKCRIEPALEIQMFRYRDDVHKIEEFNSFFQKVTQVVIPYNEQRQMMSQLGAMDDISNTLKAVETSIGFLSKTGGEPNQFYVTYLKETLLYDPKKYLPSKQMRNDIRLAHLHSTWLMLHVERALRLNELNQDPFSTCPDDFTKELEDERSMAKVRQNIRQDHVHEIIGALTEYILCDLPLRGSNYADCLLSEALDTFRSSKKMDVDECPLAFDDVIPDGILLSHICAFWKEVAQMYINI